jgi:hypothetical protein
VEEENSQPFLQAVVVELEEVAAGQVAMIPRPTGLEYRGRAMMAEMDIRLQTQAVAEAAAVALLAPAPQMGREVRVVPGRRLQSVAFLYTTVEEVAVEVD